MEELGIPNTGTSFSTTSDHLNHVLSPGFVHKDRTAPLSWLELPGAEEEGKTEPEATSAPPLLQGRIKQILWNQAARDLGLEGVDVVKRYDSGGEEEVVLMRGGRVWGGTG